MMMKGISRKEFPITATQAYLNNAASTPMTLSGARAVEEYLQDRMDMGTEANGRWNERCGGVRRKLAGLVGADAEDIALTSCTSHGLSLVAGGFEWQQGDEVIIIAPDFTANIYPWLHLKEKGVVTRIVERGPDGCFDVDAVNAKATARTRMLAVTSVDFYSGFHADLAGLGQWCRDRGVVYGVDAIQSLGVIPLDVQAMHIDFLAAGAHKWLLGSRGGGFLYISEELREQVRPLLYGWHSVENPGAFAVEHELRRDAARYEPGAAPYLALAALDAGLDLLGTVGIERIHEHVLDLTDMIREGLLRQGYPLISCWERGHRSAIMSFDPKGDAQALHAHLAERKVMVSVRRNGIRVAPFFYNDESDVERLLEALGEWKG